MGATRLASGIFSAASSRGKRCSYYLMAFVFSPLIYPDARRIAPISACVSSSDKRYYQTLILSASSNGGDASRVGHLFSSLVAREKMQLLFSGVRVFSTYQSRRETRRPPLVLALLQAINAATKR